MAKNLKNKILENVVKPHASLSWGTLKATVVNYDNYRNRADIRFQEPRGTGEMVLERVPVQIGSNGVHSSSLKNGDQVWVTFVNNSPLLPKIVGIADETYEIKTREHLRHRRKGSLEARIIRDCSRPKEKLSSVIDSDNSKFSKHMDFRNFDIHEKVSLFKQNIGYYGENEVGITNTVNSSTVKVRDDGTIDIYTSTNHGLRIDPVSRTINITSNDTISEISVAKATDIKKWSICCDDISIVSNKMDLNCEEINVSSSKVAINGREVSVC